MASAAAIDALAAGYFNASAGQAPADALAAAIRGANDAVLSAAGESGQKGAASTLVAAAIDGTSAVIGNLGDSRAYLLRDGEIRDRKSTRLNSSHVAISYAVFCLKKKKQSMTFLCELSAVYTLVVDRVLTAA